MLYKGIYKISPILKENKYKKGQFKYGDKVRILETYGQNKRYVRYIISNVIDKGLYNMYVCINPNTKCKITFTDKDSSQKEHCSSCSKKYILRGW